MEAEKKSVVVLLLGPPNAKSIHRQGKICPINIYCTSILWYPGAEDYES
jgi:hypothetical protein